MHGLHFGQRTFSEQLSTEFIPENNKLRSKNCSLELKGHPIAINQQISLSLYIYIPYSSMYSAHPDFRGSKSEKKLCTMYSAQLWLNLRAEPSSVVRENR